MGLQRNRSAAIKTFAAPIFRSRVSRVLPAGVMEDRESFSPPAMAASPEATNTCSLLLMVDTRQTARENICAVDLRRPWNHKACDAPPFILLDPMRSPTAYIARCFASRDDARSTVVPFGEPKIGAQVAPIVGRVEVGSLP
ncbi:hypothetical protein BHE74_00002317 [Ensete ventricosum]|nr:hypothetical protein BHE74_00002317 [Ensete ventricosum]